MENKITANHINSGVWRFTCYAHDPIPFEVQAVSSPKHAMVMMKKHVDDSHNGGKFRLIRHSDYSGSASETYKGKE